MGKKSRKKAKKKASGSDSKDGAPRDDNVTIKNPPDASWFTYELRIPDYDAWSTQYKQLTRPFKGPEGRLWRLMIMPTGNRNGEWEKKRGGHFSFYLMLVNPSHADVPLSFALTMVHGR